MVDVTTSHDARQDRTSVSVDLTDVDLWRLSLALQNEMSALWGMTQGKGPGAETAATVMEQVRQLRLKLLAARRQLRSPDA